MKLSRTSSVWLVTSVAFVGIIAVVGLFASAVSNTSAEDRQVPGFPRENLTPMVPEGIPAISVRAGGSPIDGRLPAFTREDVVRFITEARYHGLGSEIGVEGPVTISRVEFMTNRDLRAAFRVGTGHPDDKLLCYVELNGRFSSPGSPRGEGMSGCGKAQIVFDAETGNRLMFGVDCSGR